MENQVVEHDRDVDHWADKMEKPPRSMLRKNSVWGYDRRRDEFLLFFSFQSSMIFSMVLWSNAEKRH